MFFADATLAQRTDLLEMAAAMVPLHPVIGHRKYMRISNLPTAKLDESIVMLNLSRNNYVALDDVAARVWELLKSPRSPEELCELLQAEFEAPAGRIVADVRAFLDELLEEGLLSVE